MSTFGSPGGRQQISKPIPPERGSFPLDHDGECKPFMKRYLSCMREAKGVNVDDCRLLGKAYLQCRMDRNLMAPDEMRNLGFAQLGEAGSGEVKAADGDDGRREDGSKK